MTFSAYNALQSIHVLDTLAEQHRNRVKQAAQQNDSEGAPEMCVMRASAAEAYRALLVKEREKARQANREAGEEIKRQIIALTAGEAPDVEDAIWHEIPQIAPPADTLAEDQV